MVDTNLSKDELNVLYKEKGIFSGFNVEFVKENLEKSPCNILGLIKEFASKIELLEARVKALEDVLKVTKG